MNPDTSDRKSRRDSRRRFAIPPGTPFSRNFRCAVLTTAVLFPSLGPVIAQELGYLDSLLGVWDVKYPGPDHLIRPDYSERLELKRDGTFSWRPAPSWTSPTGTWGVRRMLNGWLELCFQKKLGGNRCHYLVLIDYKPVGPLYWNWQRTQGEAVVFPDRVLRADRPVGWLPSKQ